MSGEKVRYFEFGEFILDVRRRILLKNGEQIPLSGRIFDLLVMLVENEGQILSHDELLDKVWDGAFVEQSNLKKSISSLRQALGESPNESLFIKTIPRRGYSFVGAVRAVSEEKTEETADQPVIIDEGNITAGDVVAVPEIGHISQPADTVAVAAPQKNSNRGLYTGIAAALMLLVLVGVGIWQFLPGRVSAGDYRMENLRIQKLTGNGNVEAAVLSPDGKIFIYATKSDSKWALWAKKIGSPTPLQLIAPGNDKLAYLSVSPDNNAVYYVAAKTGGIFLYRIPILGGEPRKITEHVSSSASFVEGSRRIALVRDLPEGRRVLLTMNAEDGSDEQEIYSVTDNHRLIEPSWSPDGKRIAFIASEIGPDGRTWTVSEIPAAGGEPTHILTPQKGKVYGFDWLKDGKGMIVCTEPNDLTRSQLWHVAYPGGEMTRMTNDVDTYNAVTISADGATMLAIQRERTGDLWEMNWSLLQNSRRLTDSENYIGQFTVLPDGKIVAETVEGGQRGLATVNADGTNLQPLFAESNVEKTPSISPDGSTLYFISVRGGTQEIWQSDPDGRNPKKLTNLRTFLHTVKVSPDGKDLYFLYYDDARWRLVKMPVEGGDFTVEIEETVGEYAFSPDGTQLAYSYLGDNKSGWKAAVRNLSDNSVRQRFDIASSSMILWTRDGKGLLYTLSDGLSDGGSLWMQPLDGSAPKPVLETRDDEVLWADWARDGSKLYFTRGRIVSNMVLITKGKAN